MNNVNIMGRLTATPELKTTNSGISVCSFAIAVRKDKDTTYFIDVVAWRKTAEMVCQYWHKGDMIAITGELTQRRWEDKNGNKRSTIEVTAHSVYFCGGKSDHAGGATPPTPAGGDFEEVADDDDLPF